MNLLSMLLLLGSVSGDVKDAPKWQPLNPPADYVFRAQDPIGTELWPPKLPDPMKEHRGCKLCW